MMKKDVWYDAKKHPFPKNGIIFVIATLSRDGGGSYNVWETFFEYAKDELNNYQLFDVSADEWMEAFMFGVSDLEDLAIHWKILGIPDVKTK